MPEFPALPKLHYIGPWVTAGQAERIAELAGDYGNVQVVSLDAAYLKVVWDDGEINLDPTGEEVDADS